ncbi:MAG: formate/nitrite transporter family protein [Ktedonobacteraceae bacterium]
MNTLSSPQQDKHKKQQSEDTQQQSEKTAQVSGTSLDETEQQAVGQRRTISAIVVHEAVRLEGESELERTSVALIFSSLAAGLSMGFSLIAKGLFHAYLPASEWSPLVENLGYSLGFLIVVLGRQQLFTENTLTVILPLLSHPTRSTFLKVVRLWVLVLGGNLVGAFLFSLLVTHTPIFSSHIQLSLTDITRQATRGTFAPLMLKGIFAGWLIALMVWLLPAAESTRLHVIIIITYIVGVGEFAHIIVDAVNATYLLNLGLMSWSGVIGILFPTLLGNIIGGVSLVAVLNYAQVAGEKARKDS